MGAARARPARGAARRAGATALLQEALDIHRDLGDRWRVTSVLDDLAAAALAGQPPDAAGAARLLGAAQHIREAIGTAIAPCERAGHARSEAAARAALGDAAFAGLAGPAPPSRWTTCWPAPASAAPRRMRARRPSPHRFFCRTTAAADHRRRASRGASRRLEQGPAGPPPPAPAAGDTLRLRLLGQATVHLAGRLLTPADWGYAKPRELLCLFASSPPLAREQVGLALWPELAEGQLRNALHSALRQLRRTLGDGGWIGFADGRYALDESRPLDCDLRDFEQALAAARAAQPPAAALPHLDRAIAAYGGDFLASSTAGTGPPPGAPGCAGPTSARWGGGPPAGGRRPGARGDRRVPAGDCARTAGRGGTPRADGVLGRGRPACPRHAPLRGTARTAARRGRRCPGGADHGALRAAARRRPADLPPPAGLPPAPSVRTPCRWGDLRPIPPRFPQRPPRFPPRPRVASRVSRLAAR